MTTTAEQDQEQQLIDDIVGFEHDPLGFVLYAFPWGEPGTDLEKKTGPDEWQIEILDDIGQRLRAGAASLGEVIQEAVASGHGVGKSAEVAWLILWAMSTKEDTKGVVTANTMTQLTTKTWPEVAKWHRMLICKHWFKLTATALFSSDPERAKTWRMDAIPWSISNTEAFAGLHNEGKRLLVIFDEASAIDDEIWRVTEGALTDAETEIIWCVFGNPTKNTGRFRECFGKYRHRWHTKQVDSRSVAITNKVKIAQWVADYGEDSDFVRVRVKGVFPRTGVTQLIGTDLVEAAIAAQANSHPHDPLIMGVDVARFGDDQTVLFIRKGRDARTYPAIKLRNSDLMQTAARIADLHAQMRFDAIFVDETGIGAGVVDRLRQLRVPVTGINFGSNSDRVDPTGLMPKCANKVAEMWLTAKSALQAGMALPDDQELRDDLTGREYGFNENSEIQLEKKKDMKKRGLASPDVGDAFALTYAYPVMPSAMAGHHFAGAQGSPNQIRDYDPHNDV